MQVNFQEVGHVDDDKCSCGEGQTMDYVVKKRSIETGLD